jgi:DNA-binding PadR family transcriptional regulator
VDKPIDLVDKPLYKELKLNHPNLALQLEKAGKRSNVEDIEKFILALCAWKTLQAVEIALLLGRTSHHVKINYLSRMIRDGLLEYKFPENLSHNKQAYRTTEKGKRELR